MCDYKLLRLISKHKKRIRTWGADYLAFALLDIVIDNYTYVLGTVGDKIEKLELELLDNPDDELLPRINTYKKEVNYLRRSIKPSLEMVNILSKTDTPLIKKRTGPFYKELVYNCQMASDITDSYSEMLNDQLNFYHTTMSTKLNEIMKFLTIFSVIFIPLTFIAGIYGTNFKYIPELDYHYGYFVMMGAMFVVAIIMIIYFRRKKWM